MILDLRTLIIHFTLGNLLIAMLFAVAFRDRKDRYASIWIGSLMVHALAWILLSGADHLPNFIAVVGGLGFMCLGFAMLTDAFADFYQLPLRRQWFYLPVPLLLLALLVIGWEVDGSWARLFASNLIMGIQTAIATALVFAQRDRCRGLRYMVGLSAVAMTLVFLGRAVLLVVDPNLLPPLPANSPVQSWSFLIGSLARVTFTFGFLLLIETRRFDDVTRLATLDPLTEVFNRRTFIEIAERELAHCWRSQQPMALILLDVDHFKEVNDRYGHQAGDRILLQMKDAAGECLRRQDVFGRYGGEEFCVLAPGTDKAGAQILAERLRLLVATHAFQPSPGADPIQITISIGYAILEPDQDHVSLDDLIARSDAALYQAKGKGRNQVIGSAL